MKVLQFKTHTPQGEDIDLENGIIKGVSLISTPEAKGHNLKIDAQTIQSFFEAVAGKSIKAYYRHDPENDALSTIGLWEDFEIIEDGEYTKLKANFKALDAWRKNNEADFMALFELAQKAPEAFGVSAEFLAKQIQYGAEGEELEWDGETDGDVFARAVEVNAFSIVAQPSANPTGLFSKPTESTKVLVEKNQELAEQKNELALDLNTAEKQLAVFAQQNEKLEKEVAELKAQLAEATTALESQEANHQKQLAEMGCEPVVAGAGSATELTFEQQLAQCKTWSEKSKLFNANMQHLMQTW